MLTHSTVRLERRLPLTRRVIDDAAPIYHARGSAPPILIIVGSSDLPGRAKQNRDFAAALKEAGHGDVTYIEVPNRDHRSLVEKLAEPEDPASAAIRSFTTVSPTPD